MQKDFKYLYLLCVEKWQKIQLDRSDDAIIWDGGGGWCLGLKINGGVLLATENWTKIWNFLILL